MKKTNGIKHIFFDLDHTLWDFEANSDIAFEKIFKQHKLELDVPGFLMHYRGINQQYWKLYREEKISKARLRYGRLRDTFDLLNMSIEDAIIDQLAIDYITELPKNNYLFEGTYELLDHLYENYQMHIITNGFNEVQYKKIKNAGLSVYFNEIITSEDAGVKKPNPIIFKYALDKVKASPSEVIMIGDNWEADIMGALNLGIDAIYFNYHRELVGENIKSVNSLVEIKRFL